MNSKKPYKLSDIESHILGSQLESNWITIIGIGDFGEAALNKLMKYQKAEPKVNFCSSFVHIKYGNYERALPWMSGMSDGVILDTSLVVIIGDSNDPICLEVCGKLSKTFQGKFIVCFLCGTENNAVLPSVDAIVQINEDMNEAFLAARLFPDMLRRNGLVAICLEDVTETLKLGKFFKLHELNFTKKELKDVKDLENDIFTGGSGISCVYGDEELEMILVDKIARLVAKKCEEADNCVFTTLVAGPENDEVKLVTLLQKKR